MQDNYDTFIKRVISRYEGGYGWDSGDTGGPTKYGITCWDLAEHMGKRMTSMSAWAPIVRSMSLETAEQIYIEKYAKKDRFNELESGSDCVILDYGINSGVLRPVWVAQHITGRRQTNIFDNDLVKAINDYNAVRFIDRMCDERMAFLRSLSIWPKFKGGWTTRVADLRQYCHHIARDQQPNMPPDTIDDRVPTIKVAQSYYNQLYNLKPPLDVDGFEGDKTKEVTRRFQREHPPLDVDGLIGEHTMAALAEAVPQVSTTHLAQGFFSMVPDMAEEVMAKGIEHAVDIIPDHTPPLDYGRS